MTKQEASLNCLSNSGKLWEPKTIDLIDKVHIKAIEFSQGPKIFTNSGLSISGHWWTGISNADKEGFFTYDSNGETFPFRKVLSMSFYPDFIQIVSTFYPDFI